MLCRTTFFLAGLWLLAVDFTNAQCLGPLVSPDRIDVPNFKLCDNLYKFDSAPEYDEWGQLIVPGIPAEGECSTFTWENVPSCDGTTSGPVTVEVCIERGTNGQTVRFSITQGIAKQVYVKGGPGGNLYSYDPGVAADCGLHAPLGAGRGGSRFYGVSHISFCLCYVPDDVPCYVDETAWADGLRYVPQGNWATYTPYAGELQTVTLWAGQHYDAGDVTFSTPDGDGNITITIQLNDGFHFAPVTEPVKVQDYAFPPSGNPSPGSFDWKNAVINANQAYIVVPANSYYGVHVDVLREVDCDE